MPNVEFSDLIWDEYNQEHIVKHCVSIVEIEEVLQDPSAKEAEAHSGRFLKLGRSGKRLLTIVLTKEDEEKFYVVTARDMSKNERRFYRNDEKEK